MTTNVGVERFQSLLPLLLIYLPTSDWLDNDYQPIQSGFDAFIKRHGWSDQAKEIIACEKAEIVIYEKYRDCYNHSVYIAKKRCKCSQSDMVCQTHRRLFKRELKPCPFSVSGKCRELNFSWHPAV